MRGRLHMTIAVLVLLACVPLDGKEPPLHSTQPKGYSIPIVDVSGETHRQVVVDKEAGQYLGHPTTVLLEDGKTMITVYRASMQNKLTGFAYQVTGLGYAGPIEIMLGVDTSGRILGARVISHSETPGLGDKIEIKKHNWIESFNGLSLGAPSPEKWKVKKDGGQFDQFTGATITPRAVINAVRQGLEFFQQHRTELVHIDSKTTAQE